MKAALLADGSSDRALLPVLRWALHSAGVDSPIVVHTDLRVLPRPVAKLQERIVAALALEPCDLLFVHRDAEKMSLTSRTEEIDGALAAAAVVGVPVVPVRMSEAWLLIDEAAIRRAAGNPEGGMQLRLPGVRRLEQLPDPKKELYALLVEASGLTGRKRERFRPSVAIHQLAEYITDFSALRELLAFRQFEARLRVALTALERSSQ